jgi:hypothetical protein
LGTALSGSLAHAQGFGDSAEKGQGRQWAVLIGIEKYQKANPLRYTINDVKRLAETLKGRGGFDQNCVFEITDDAPDPETQPLKASLLAGLPRWLSQPTPEDRLIVYFSGHGFRDPSGKLYLAPIDCDPADPASTGIPVEWFRQQIAACKAGFKLLILDACHAGSEKGDDDGNGVPSKDIGETFRDLSGVVTLASSTGQEKSQIWEERQQSLFSYWLNQGMKGHADADGDGVVEIDELYKYVYRNVTRSAKNHFPRAQTPVRIVRTGVEGSPMVLRLIPQKLKQLLADMAEQLTLAAEERKVQKIGVLEFTTETSLGELLGANFGLLGRWCSEELEKDLADQGDGKFTVADRRKLQKALTDGHFSVDDLGSADKLKALSQRLNGLPVLAQGTLRSRAGRVVTLQCKLIRTDSDDMAGTAGGSAVLSESEWAMLGRSVVVKPEDRIPALPVPGQTSAPSQEDAVVKKMDERSDGPNPLLDPNFPFPIRIMINGKERKPIVRGNDWIIPVHQGEVYSIDIENRANRLVCMRLLVDGLNTLPELEDTKGISTMVVAKRVSLERARHWSLDPKVAKLFSVRGFVTATGEEGELRRFEVSNFEKLPAARKQFTDQLGIITAAFYEAGAGSRGPGGHAVTILGDKEKAKLKERATRVGNLIAVVNIRYLDADEANVAGR